MTKDTTATMQRAQDAAAAGEWHEAYELVLEAERAAPLDTAGLAFLADVAYAAGHLDVTITAWERAYAQAMHAGHRLEAAGAAVKVAFHILIDTALLAPVRAWVLKAESLLGQGEETPLHAWLAVLKNYERLLSGDLETAYQWACRAVEIGSRLEPAAAAIGVVAESRSLLLRGEVEAGMARLNEAGDLLLTSDLPPLMAGIVYCEFVCGLQGLAQYELAEQWTDAMERWHPGKAVGSIHGRCRVHRAEVLRRKGEYRAADTEARLACEELQPYLRRELGWPLTELGRIRLRMGDLEGAEEALLRAQALGWEAQPDLALVYLARGQSGLAVASIREALDKPRLIPSKELPPHTELRRAPLLDAAVKLELKAGDPERARLAVEELARIAERFGSTALKASAAQARGRVLLEGGDWDEALAELETALHLWSEVGAPYESAAVHEELATVHRRRGQEDLAELELRTCAAMFEQLGAKLDLSRVRLAMEPAADGGSQSSAGSNLLRREGDFWTMAFNGQEFRLRDLKGLHYLARLLGSPGQELHVLDLVATEAGNTAKPMRTSDLAGMQSRDLQIGDLLDKQARDIYRRRLSEIEADIAEAEAMGDKERVLQAQTERSFLAHELARAVGFGGRGRRGGVHSERARASVTKSLRQAIARIEAYNPAMAHHFDRAIRTGTYCAYLPDTTVPPDWSL
ncbi:MAG TPA: transcriptional regulator [Dehalococcoidia bacterium]|nr:transcriptional regulator [Dehalococcoidia bacterium]